MGIIHGNMVHILYNQYDIAEKKKYVTSEKRLIIGVKINI